MRTAILRPAMLCLLISACVSSTPTTTVSTAPAPTLSAEEAFALQTANARRDTILNNSSWMDFEGDACNPGVLRTFGKDTVAEEIRKTEQTVEALERQIIARGLDVSLDSPVGHELLRTVIAWESGTGRPRWDVPRGVTPPQAIAAGLSGEYKNPETGKCEEYVPFDTMNIVIPNVANFIAPRTNKVVLGVFKGDSGLARLRDQYYSAHAHLPNAVLLYTRVRLVVMWNDYAVVAVNRPAEARGVVQLPQGGGGASYIFHRAGGEWRLLVIARTWG